jgi:CheY-like chemotaxis protein
VEKKLTTTVLVVEDVEIIQLADKIMLENLGCMVTIAATAAEALDLFQPHYQMVLMDINLPDGSGIDVCRKIRHQYPDLNTPIIAFTAQNFNIQTECLKAGMQDFIQKPASQDTLRQMLARWIPNEA